MSGQHDEASNVTRGTEASTPGEVAMPAFRGYNPIRYTPCPDEFFDEQMADMDEDELRVTLYAFRRTFGFKKTDDAISISQFLHGITTRDGRRLDHGCGLKTPRQVLSGLSKAERRRTLLSAFFCRACGQPMPNDVMLDEQRSQRMVNGERRQYTVRVVPRLCPHCGARLRGFEEKRYLLNVLDETSQARGQSAPPSVQTTDPPSIPAPSVSQADPLCPPGSVGSASQTDTRDSLQETDKQGVNELPIAVQADVRETTGVALPEITPAFLPPGGRLPSPQLWATAVAQAALEPVDRDGWARAATLLAAEQLTGGAGAGLTLIVGVPTDHARRRCGGRAGTALAAVLAVLLGQPVRVEPVVTSVWLAERAERDR